MKPVEEIKQLQEKLFRRVNERDQILNKTAKVDEVEIKCDGRPPYVRMSVKYDCVVWNMTWQDTNDEMNNLEKECRRQLLSGLIDFMLPGFQEAVDVVFSYLKDTQSRLLIFGGSVSGNHLEDPYFDIMELLQTLKRFSVVATRTGEPWKCQ